MPFNPLRTHMAGTQWYMCHGERKLSTDANDGAEVEIGTWKPNRQYLIVGYFAATPAGLPAWDDSFFISCATTNGYTGALGSGLSYILFDHGAGPIASNTQFSVMLFPGTRWVPGCTDLIYGIDAAVPGIFDFTFNFRADGKLFKQWQGFGGGNDWYLLITEKSI